MRHSGIRLDSLPPAMRAQVEAQLGPGKPLHENPSPGPVPHPKPQRHPASALVRATPRKTGGVPRVTVRFIGRRVRPLDPDNFAGSCKDLLDGLRHAGLISGDEPWRIRLETEQVRVRSFAEEMTVVEIK